MSPGSVFFSSFGVSSAFFCEDCNNVLSCCKHYCATGDGFGGINTAEVNIGQRELHDICLPVVEKAVKAGADVVMAAYNDAKAKADVTIDRIMGAATAGVSLP